MSKIFKQVKRITISATLLLALSLVACNTQNEPDLVVEKQDLPSENLNDMHNFISLFEIPAIDMTRAINFYQTILDIHIEKMEMPGMEIGVWPYEGQMVSGVLMKEEGLKPSSDGVTIYLNGGDNLQTILDKVEGAGGTIIVPKTAHADESGFFALFLDTEGNKLGLNSPQ